jgi:hypothetical protein
LTYEKSYSTLEESYKANEGGVMDFYEIVAWMLLVFLAVARIALVVGIVFVVVAVVKGVCKSISPQRSLS